MGQWKGDGAGEGRGKGREEEWEERMARTVRSGGISRV